MKAAIIANKNYVEIRSMPIPVVAPDEVLVKVEACGVCATDVHIFRGEIFPNYPLVPGHGFSGVVEEIGSAVANLKAGDHVAVDPSVFCEA